jgi:hypothetical protein
MKREVMSLSEWEVTTHCGARRNRTPGVELRGFGRRAMTREVDSF